MENNNNGSVKLKIKSEAIKSDSVFCFKKLFRSK